MPASHRGGSVRVFKVKIDVVSLRPNSLAHHGLSNSLINARVARDGLSRPPSSFRACIASRKGHVNTAVLPALRMGLSPLGAASRIPPRPTSIRGVFRLRTSQRMNRLRTANHPLGLCTSKGFSNGEAAEGDSAEKIGSVGQGGPPNIWYMDATKPAPPTIRTTTIHSITRIQRRRSLVGFADWIGALRWLDC